MRPFVVNVADLVNRPGARRRERLSGPLAGIRVSTSFVPDGSVAVVDAELAWVSEGLLVTGQVTAPWGGECRRCLRHVEGELTADVRELFELHPTDADSYRLKGDLVDLEPLVKEHVTLELPLAPLCDRDCLGLCPQCGADRNQGDCGCVAAAGDSRWAVLETLSGLGAPAGDPGEPAEGRASSAEGQAPSAGRAPSGDPLA